MTDHGIAGLLDRPTLSGEPLRQARAVEVLERLGTAEARELLKALANGVKSHP